MCRGRLNGRARRARLLPSILSPLQGRVLIEEPRRSSGPSTINNFDVHRASSFPEGNLTIAQRFHRWVTGVNKQHKSREGRMQEATAVAFVCRISRDPSEHFGPSDVPCGTHGFQRSRFPSDEIAGLLSDFPYGKDGSFHTDQQRRPVFFASTFSKSPIPPTTNGACGASHTHCRLLSADFRRPHGVLIEEPREFLGSILL